MDFPAATINFNKKFLTVSLLLSSLITGGDLSLPGQRVVALALLFDIYKLDNPFTPLFVQLLENKPGLQPLAPQERALLAQLHGLVPANVKEVSKWPANIYILKYD